MAMDSPLADPKESMTIFVRSADEEVLSALKLRIWIMPSNGKKVLSQGFS